MIFGNGNRPSSYIHATGHYFVQGEAFLKQQTLRFAKLYL